MHNDTITLYTTYSTDLELLVDSLLETDGSTCFRLRPACTKGPEEEDLPVSFLERENKDNSDSELGVTSAKSNIH